MPNNIETIRLEYVGGSSSKFWEITKVSKPNPSTIGPLTQYGYMTTWGRIGSAGQRLAEHKWKWYHTESACNMAIRETIAGKRKKGYQMTGKETHNVEKQKKEKKNHILMRVRSMKIS
tara:strand:- start:2897 stop:3250 length:354 start_codon:yes stop_codon:yes gene_type:complete